MATNTSQSTQSSDMPWIIGSGLVFVPTVAWILSSGKGDKHVHHSPKASTEHGKTTVKDTPNEPVPEPVAVTPAPEPVPEEKPAEPALEPSASESVVSDDDGVVVSNEEVEESINKALDADVPKEAKIAEANEAPSEPEPTKESEAPAPQKVETTESNPPLSEEPSSEKKETTRQ